jgi:heme A synthase
MTLLYATLATAVGAPIGWLMVRTHAQQLTRNKRLVGGGTLGTTSALLWGYMLYGLIAISSDMASTDPTRTSDLPERFAFGFIILAPVINFIACLSAGAAMAHLDGAVQEGHK